jgi:hypothetical protein
MQVHLYAKIYSTHIVFYNQYLLDNGNPISRVHHDISKEKNKVKGDLSFNARKRMQEAFDGLFAVARKTRIRNPIINKMVNHYISFITLTLPSKQIHCDQTIKNVCLNNFLQILRTTHYLENYVWKAEKQKNGNIHFHIGTDLFLHMNDIRNAWQSSLELLGYMTRYNSNWKEMQVPCTDVQEARNYNGIVRYFRKYLAKSGQGSYICGAVWSASESVMAYKAPEIICAAGAWSEMAFLSTNRPDLFWNGEHSRILKLDQPTLRKLKYYRLTQPFYENIQSAREKSVNTG